jgi:hypothetical protein
MKLKRICGFLVVIFVLFWVISKPGGASHSVNRMVGHLHEAGTSISTFMTNIL